MSYASGDYPDHYLRTTERNTARFVRKAGQRMDKPS